MEALQSLSILFLLLQASQVQGWGGGGYGWPKQPPPAIVTTWVNVYTPTIVYETTPAPVNPETGLPPNPTQGGGGETTQPDTGSSTAVAEPSSAGAPLPSGSSTPNSCGSNVQKISLDNQSGNTLIIQAGPPWTVGTCGSIADQDTCTFCLPRASTGGNLQIGYGAANARATWIEGNWVTTAQWATVDISFIPGYSVPISCTSDLTGATNGWSTPLCSDSQCSNCNSGGGTWDGNACENPAGDADNPIPNGPCPSFFSSSANGAYCFPNDNGVVGFGEPWSSVSCTAYPQSGGASNSKRDANNTVVPQETEQRRSTVLEKRGHARHSRHGGARAHARSLKNILA